MKKSTFRNCLVLVSFHQIVIFVSTSWEYKHILKEFLYFRDENGYNSDQQLSFDGDDCNYGVSDDEFDYDYEDGDAGEGNEKFFYLRDRSDIMSQYTGRSMSSAIMRKTEGHQTIDAKFELVSQCATV